MRAIALMGMAALALAGCEQQAAAPAENGAAAAAEGNAAAPAAAGSESPLAIAAADGALQWGPCPEGMPAGCSIAVLHGDPAKPNADIFFKVPGGAAIPPHAHTSAERMVLVGGSLEVQYEGNPPELLREGHYAYGPAKMPHRAQCRSSEDCILFIAFEGPVDVLPAEMAG